VLATDHFSPSRPRAALPEHDQRERRDDKDPGGTNASPILHCYTITFLIITARATTRVGGDDSQPSDEDEVNDANTPRSSRQRASSRAKTCRGRAPSPSAALNSEVSIRSSAV